MPSATAKGYPYPLGSDRVMDGDDAIHSLADAIDTKQPAATWVGPASVVLTNVAAANVTVTLPAGRFAVAPRVSLVSRAASNYFAYMNSGTPTSISLGVRNYAGTLSTATVLVDVIAVQMLANNSDG